MENIHESLKKCHIEVDIKNALEKIEKEKFEKKYVIVGDIIFYGGFAEILRISEEKMFYDESSFELFMDKIEDEGQDYIILPNYKFQLLPNNTRVLDAVNRIITMAKDIGWGKI